MSIAFLSGLTVQEDTTWHKCLLCGKYALKLRCLKNKLLVPIKFFAEDCKRSLFPEKEICFFPGISFLGQLLKIWIHDTYLHHHVSKFYFFNLTRRYLVVFHFCADPCELACVSSGLVLTWHGLVTDGNRCTNRPDIFDVCIAGKCRVRTNRVF